MLFHKEALLQSETYNDITKKETFGYFSTYWYHRHWYTCGTVKSISRNHPGKNRCPANEGSSSQPDVPLHCFGSDVPIVLTSMQEKGEDECRKTSR
ncbi:hypothetical protein AVEN_203492-1 [Araneus ventricosus]|uniref:Uncharacterized protein n=1 Tax=Araneus ventricosus TaxID=182803 RepID=A0A4Y2BGG3_ARAVE|nr:hypothetical protein AVEN_203492-1 [Araneus ventricosus]